MKIMKVKQQDGSIVSIPLGQGANGKSAYEYAKDGGYTGTEAEFAVLLAGIGTNDDAQKGTFIAEYGVTPIEEVIEAVRAGQFIICREIDDTAKFDYFLSYHDSGEDFTYLLFIAPIDESGVLRFISLSSSDGWGEIEEHRTLMEGEAGVVPVPEDGMQGHYLRLNDDLEVQWSWSPIEDFNADISELYHRVETLETDVEYIKEQLKCLRGDTQILMADGTTKDIKDVKYGDMIRSFDIENNCFVDVKSYGAYCTGYEQFWNVCGFTNGSVLYIGGDGHYIYHYNTQQLILSDKFPIKGGAFDTVGVRTKEEMESGNDYPSLVGRGRYNAMKIEKRYELLSENGLYFANGILVGHKPATTYHHYLNGNAPLNEEEIAAITEDIKVYQDAQLEGLNNPEFLKEAGLLFRNVNKHKEYIEKNKRHLADLDYKQVKRNQGKLSDKDYASYLAECDEYRAKINEDEKFVADNSIILDELRAKHGIVKANHKQNFLDAHHRQMERIRNRK